MRCNGKEAKLDECIYTSVTPESTSYRSYSVAGVICQGSRASEPECSKGEFRLAEGESENEGTVEFCMDGFWGTVYDGGWDKREAVVACRQAELPTNGKTSIIWINAWW